MGPENWCSSWNSWLINKLVWLTKLLSFVILYQWMLSTLIRRKYTYIVKVHSEKTVVPYCTASDMVKTIRTNTCISTYTKRFKIFFNVFYLIYKRKVFVCFIFLSVFILYTPRRLEKFRITLSFTISAFLIFLVYQTINISCWISFVTKIFFYDICWQTSRRITW